MPVISARGMSARDAGGLLAEAGDRAAQALFEVDLRLEAHELAGARDVEEALGLAVGPRGVPHGLALEADQALDRLGEVADARLLAGADVDRIGGLQPLGRQQQGPRRVVDVEELAARVAGAPQDDLLVATLG